MGMWSEKLGCTVVLGFWFRKHKFRNKSNSSCRDLCGLGLDPYIPSPVSLRVSTAVCCGRSNVKKISANFVFAKKESDVVHVV